MAATNTLNIDKGNAITALAEIARKLEIPVDKDCQKTHLTLPKQLGHGRIRAYKVSEGLDSLIFNVEFKQRLVIRMHGHNAQPLLFYTAARGNALIDAERGSFELAPLQGVIHGAYGDGDYSWTFPSGERLLLMVTMVHRQVFFQDVACSTLELPPPLLRVVKGQTDNQDHYLFDSIYHLPAVDAVHNVVNHSETGLLHSTHASAMIHENMFLLLNEYTRQLASQNLRVVKGLDKIKLIQAAEKIIDTNLQDPPTIPELARLVGINQQTLKTGFRQLYGTSINQYLNDKRLQKASILISAGELSISEVANIVGYSNGGYFTRKFKQKYGIPPSKFCAQTA